jgi:hypothetical protein
LKIQGGHLLLTERVDPVIGEEKLGYQSQNTYPH